MLFENLGIRFFPFFQFPSKIFLICYSFYGNTKKTNRRRATILLLLHELLNIYLQFQLIIVIKHLFHISSPQTKNQHPALMVLLVIAMSGIGYGLTQFFRHFMALRRRGLLDPPADLLDDGRKGGAATTADADDNGEQLIGNRSRFSKAQARQRFRKGKS